MEAFSVAGVKASDIDVVIPHGIGTGITDLHEARSVVAAFEGFNDYSVSAFKGYFGHNLGSCAFT